MARTSALESIFYQINSPLGRGLEEAFNAAILYRDTLDYTGVADNKKVAHRYTQMHNYAKRTLFPAMIKAISAGSNLVINKIVDVRSFTGMFAVNIGLDDYEDVVAVLARQTGETPGGDKLSEGAQEVADLNKKLDERLSKLKSTKFGKTGRPISANMYMDVDMAFLMQDNLPVNAVESMTASELTAIYLHEIGHMLTLISQSANAYQVYEQTKDQLKRIRASGKADDLSKAVTIYKTKLRPVFEQQAKKRVITDKVLKLGDSVVESIEYWQNTDRSDVVTGTLAVIGYVMFNVYFSLLFLLLRLYFYILVYPLTRLLVWVATDKPGEFGKSTDQSTSNSVYYHAERMADQFAVKHGYGGSLASGLAKITSAGKYITALVGMPITQGSLRDSTAFLLYLKSTIVLTELFRIDGATFSADFFGPSNYESDMERLDSILKDLNAAFKRNLPPEAISDYLSDIDRVRKAIKDTKRPWTTRASDMAWKYIFDFPTMIRRVAQADDMEEMELFNKRLVAITDNELYASAAAFKLLAR